MAVTLAGALAARAGTPPTVSSVSASQQAGTKLVNISYTISDANFTSVSVFVFVSKDSGATWDVPARTFISGSAVGVNVPVAATPTAKSITWDAGADWDGQYTANCRVRVLANNLGLAVIPPGSYNRGNSSGDSDITDAPVYSVYVSAFYMDQNHVSGGLWGLVKGYADAHGYTFVHSGSYKASTHPIQTVDWYDAVKWCNARSEREGLTPVYYTDAGFTTVYRTGEASPYWKPGANGYRLPTEAEWEKAARGGLSGKRFPWGDTITHTNANYYSSTNYSYDVSATRGYHPTYDDGIYPYTSPVGSFAPNGYNLYDMAGNVYEWCWDWYGSAYYTSGQSDPQGPSTGDGRVLRGGAWDYNAFGARCVRRIYNPPSLAFDFVGFRCVRGL